MLEEAFLSVLALELRQLLGGHLAAIWGEGTVHFAADGEEDFLVGISRESCGQPVFENGHAALEVFQVERAGRIEQRQRFVEARGDFFEAN